jgi:hypothetical protein
MHSSAFLTPRRFGSGYIGVNDGSTSLAAIVGFAFESCQPSTCLGTALIINFFDTANTPNLVR